MSKDHVLSKIRSSTIKVRPRQFEFLQKLITTSLFCLVPLVSLTNVSHGITPRPQYHNGMEHFAGDFLFYSEDDRLCEIFDEKNWNANRGIPRPGAKDIELVEFADWQGFEYHHSDGRTRDRFEFLEEGVSYSNNGEKFVLGPMWGFVAGFPHQVIGVFGEQAADAIKRKSIFDHETWFFSFFKDFVSLTHFGQPDKDRYPTWYHVKNTPNKVKDSFSVIDPESLYKNEMLSFHANREVTTYFKYQGRVYFFTKRPAPRPSASIENLDERRARFQDAFGITNAITAVVFEHLEHQAIREVCLYSGLPIEQ